VGAQPQADAGAGEGGKVGAVHVFLAEVHAVGAFFEGELPVVVDEKLAMRAAGGGDGTADFPAQGFAGEGFAAQLHGVCAGIGHTRHPIGIGHHGVEFEGADDGGKGLHSGRPAGGWGVAIIAQPPLAGMEKAT